MHALQLELEVDRLILSVMQMFLFSSRVRHQSCAAHHRPSICTCEKANPCYSTRPPTACPSCPTPRTANHADCDPAASKQIDCAVLQYTL